MWKTILVVAALAAGISAALPTAQACCHGAVVYEEAGPCTVDVWLDLVSPSAGKHARAGCAGAEAGIEFCHERFGAGWVACWLP